MVLSAILNLGNIQFDASPNDDSCIKIDSRNFLTNAAALLKVDEMELENALTTHAGEIGKSIIK